MKTVYKIAKSELRQLFYSPIAWFLLVVFMIQCGAVYVSGIDYWAREQEMGGRALASMETLTARIFGYPSGVFGTILRSLYLYIPLLTMGLLSRETSSGTIKLLYSSPVKVWQIVCGKYLSMMIYSLMMLLVLVVTIIMAWFNILSVDMGMLWSGLLAFYLLLCAYAAIGLFMSSLTTYQVLAGISTFVMIGFLAYVGELWQRVDFVRDITYFLSISGRTEKMLGGLITSKDVLYFLIIIYMFLAFTMLKLRSTRESKPFQVQVLRYGAIIISALLAGYITSRPVFVAYYDGTTTKSNTLTPNAAKVIKELGDGELEITLYNNLMDNYYRMGLPDGRNRYLALWEDYLRFKPDISFKYIHYWDTAMANGGTFYHNPDEAPKTLKQQAELIAKSAGYDFSFFKTPEEMSHIIDLKPEFNRFVMHLKYKDKSTFLRVFNDMMVFPTETEVAAAIKRLQQAKFPRITFLTGNLERSPFKAGDRDYAMLASQKTFRYSFVNQGFDVDTLSADAPEIPETVSTLVISDPKTALEPATLNKIRAYIEKGGNLMIMTEPGKKSVIDPVLKPLGMALSEGCIVQPSADFAPDMVKARLTEDASGLHYLMKKKFEDSVAVVMSGVAGLQLTADSGFKVHPLLVTDAKLSWNRNGKLVADSGNVVFEEGDVKGSFPAVVALKRNIKGKEQRIIVTGDADMMSNAELNRNSMETANFAFNTALFSWLSNGEFPVNTTRLEGYDKRMKISSGGVSVLRIVLVWIVPALLLLFGSVLLIRRKRK